ncbi:hypothetical protein H113_02344 [Trichophyton rubrum MR1459]|uniref:Uncharacterized protein n=1 Tax=Trichophyton soudanense CBS 452.61 TaxID=1215331 RepID=A0A022Y129_TRISD|nr:hypothetical protein H102_02331 [Trichophyton rubrum CBS 100081]EZF65650.1 hypothetical protein H104_02317 [Trichophyton rubrum CBS 289.86]EZF76293.1 hypothetical protein H105_02352 [Trichophyton soudanense CBS 452.61]EZF86911.1 hypothetical protein H110_02338 [Trichophyton rubrum MR1448]EZF97734.1 hypothetical protein H113_02344 [Trichophyton rubrum MR1459]EZG19251.1 hypothetical protein H107_02413 [Trichophyton rubrum CBS 202.88]
MAMRSPLGRFERAGSGRVSSDVVCPLRDDLGGRESVGQTDGRAVESWRRREPLTRLGRASLERTRKCRSTQRARRKGSRATGDAAKRARGREEERKRGRKGERAERKKKAVSVWGIVLGALGTQSGGFEADLTPSQWRIQRTEYDDGPLKQALFKGAGVGIGPFELDWHCLMSLSCRSTEVTYARPPVIDGRAVTALLLSLLSFISLACALCSAWWARGEAAIDSTSRISQLAPLRI